jgi:ParB family chromosome partitioning protein
MGHARALLALGAVPQVQLAERIAAEALSVRAAEQLVRRAADGADSAGKASRDPAEPLRRQAADRDLARLEEELSDLLATPVALRARLNGSGQVLIRYATLDQLDGILRRLRGA